MNFFGLIIGPYILMVFMALLILALGKTLLRGNWLARFAGLLIFASASGWLASILLFDNARLPGLGLPAAWTIALLAACYAALLLYQSKDVPRQPLMAGRSVAISRNGIIAGSLLLVTVLVTFGYIAGADWESFFRFDNKAANRAYEETTNGVLRFANRLLLSFDRFLAR